jgi:membrane protein YqaA with SNARE-associated domain
MRSFSYSLFGYFLTPAGLVLLGVLDASLVFFLPLGIDFVVIVLSARRPELFWIYALLATVGSVAGAAATFWIGRKIGEHGLTRLIKPSRLKRIQQRVKDRAAGVAAFAIVPPPFPFTPIVLTSGALSVHAGNFFTALTAARVLRFGIESGLAAVYGRSILVWMQSPGFEVVVGALAVLALAGTALSSISILRARRRG